MHSNHARHFSVSVNFDISWDSPFHTLELKVDSKMIKKYLENNWLKLPNLKLQITLILD